MPVITRGANKRAHQIESSPLLSLPWELRSMIWKLVIGPEPYLLHPAPFKWDKLQINVATQCTAMSASYLDNSCATLHGKPAYGHEITMPPADDESPTEPNRSGALSWLRTCRLIHTEAKKLLVNNISLHICDGLTYQAALERGSCYLPLSQIRFLTLCVPIKVASDCRGHFWYFYNNNTPERYIRTRGIEPIRDRYRRWAHWNESSIRALDEDIWTTGKEFTRLEKLTLHVFFECHPFQGRCAAMPNLLANDHFLNLILYPPRDPVSGLQWVGGTSHETVEDIVSVSYTSTMVDVFREENTAPALEVRFDRKGVRHDPWDIGPDARDRCWCWGRWIEEETVPWQAIENVFRLIIPEAKDSEESA